MFTKKLWLPKLHNLNQFRPFFVSLCLFIALFISVFFYYLYDRTEKLMLQRVREQAVAYSDLIHHAKSWNYDYGSVYVEKKPGVESNTYLKSLGIEPDVKGENGRTFTLRNHAIMVSEISRRSERQDGISFRITAPRPVDLANIPDSFEKQGLANLAKGDRDYYQLLGEINPPKFRYMSPLYADRTCIECHRGESFKYGDVIGAISISIPVRKQLDEIQVTQLIILLSGAFSIALLLTIAFFLTWRLAVGLDHAQRQLTRLATTDELTGLNNRRQVIMRLEEEMQRAVRQQNQLGLISIDIDHFKAINDTYGHPFGDCVLQSIAERIRQAVRSYDIVGRIGGEEFLVVVPGVSREETIAQAERILSLIRDDRISDGQTSVTVTASAGVAFNAPNDSTLDFLLKRVDGALYLAKGQGRNRVVCS